MTIDAHDAAAVQNATAARDSAPPRDRRPSREDYLETLRTESARFAEVLGEIPAETPVPSCPEWDVAELLWHLGKVQWFWAHVVGSGCAHPRELSVAEPERPADVRGLRAFGHSASADLLRVLEDTPSDRAAWSWSAEQTVGFAVRRQAHEMLVHRVDAELAAGARTPLPVAMSADGVDEALTIMHGTLPAWADFTPTTASVRIEISDVDQAWMVTPGRIAGTNDAGDTKDEPALRVESDPSVTAGATLRGTAADLECWVWNRPHEGELEKSGDLAALAALQEVVNAGV